MLEPRYNTDFGVHRSQSVAIFGNMWRDLIWGKRQILAEHGKKDSFKINDDGE